MVKLVQLQQHLKNDAALFFESLADTEQEYREKLTIRMME